MNQFKKEKARLEEVEVKWNEERSALTTLLEGEAAARS